MLSLSLSLATRDYVILVFDLIQKNIKKGPGHKPACLDIF